MFKNSVVNDNKHQNKYFSQQGGLVRSYRAAAIDFPCCLRCVSSLTITLTDTGEDWKLVNRPFWPKVDASIFFFFPTRPSDEYDSASSQKYSRPLLDVFACIG